MFKSYASFLVIVLFVGCGLAFAGSGDVADSPQTAAAGGFMGQPEDDDRYDETTDGREYVSMTRVQPGQWDTYEYLKRTGRLVADEFHDGRVYYAVERAERVEVSIFDDEDAAAELMMVVHRYRAKIPTGQEGASADVPPDRVVDDIPHTDEAIFANFTPACFALICEGGIMEYKFDGWSSLDDGVFWAAQRAVDRGEAECLAIAEHALPTHDLEDRLMSGGVTMREIDEEEFGRESVERRCWHIKPGFLPGEHEDGEFAADLAQPVSAGEMLAASVASKYFGMILSGGWWREQEDAGPNYERSLDIAAMLAGEGGFVAGAELVARGTIPADKQALYEHACRKAEFIGVYMLRDLLVEVSAVEMGISEVSPAEQEEILAAWEDQLDSVRNYVTEYGTGDLLSFPGRRPWLPTAGEAMGLETGLTAEDLANAESVDLFIAALESEDLAERREGAWNLRRISTAAAPASDSLIAALGPEDTTLRKYAINALARIGEKVTDPPATAEALMQVLASGPAAEVRSAAIEALGQVGYVDEAIIEHLLAALSDEDEGVSASAGFAIRLLDVPADQAVPRLIELLQGDDVQAVRAAAWAIDSFGEDAADAVDILVGLLDADDAGVRFAAFWSLATMAPDHEAMVPKAMEMLVAEEISDRRTAIMVLSRIGVGAVEAVPLLIEALADDESDMARSIGYAIESIGIEAEHVPPLLELLTHDSADTRKAVLYALSGTTVPDKSAIVAAVVPLIADEEIDVRAAACSCLYGFGSEAACGLGALRELADSTADDNVREYATYAIEHISQGMDDEEVLDTEE